MAGSVLDTDFRLLSVAPNTGEILSSTRSNALAESPRELIFRFTGEDDVDRTTLRQGIWITRSGGDGVFGNANDQRILPAYLDFADSSNKRVVVARFDQPLLDDLYRVEIFGVDLAGIPGQEKTAIRTLRGPNGEPPELLVPRRSGTDRDTYTFNLELGTKIAAIVPQPIVRGSTGALTQDLRIIEVYFNDSELYDLPVTTDTAPGATNPSVVDPRFYQLIATRDSVTPFDDRVFQPQTITYNPATKKATLTFSQPIHQLAGSGTYRLRIGSDRLLSSETNNTTVPFVNVPTDPEGYLTGAFAINSGTPISSNFSTILQQEVRTVSDQLFLNFPGSSQEPGHRDIQEDRSLRTPDVVWGPPNFAPDAAPEIRTIKYNFMENQAYGVDSNGRRLFTAINSDQKQRIREIFEFYSRFLGVDFQEYSGPTSPGIFNIVVGDMFPIRATIAGPGDILGAAGQAPNPDNPNDPNDRWEMAILDGSEPWDNAFGFGVSNKPLGAETVPDTPAAQQGPFSFFNTAMHEIGHLLGFDHTYDLPAGTIMGSDNNGGITNTAGGIVGTRLNSPANPLEQIFPGTIDQIHGQHLFRPDNRDVDLYRFQLGAPGQVRLETIAERLNDSSNLDTYLTLLRGVRASAVSNLGFDSGVQVEFTANLAGEFGNNLKLVVTQSNRVGLPSVILLDPTTIAIDLNSTPGSESTLGELVAALSSNPSVTALMSITLRSGNPATVLGNRNINYSPISLTGGRLDIVAANNNYFSQDSFIDVPLTAGEYFVAVTGKGNEDSNPQLRDTGSGATSQGLYQLRFEFQGTDASSIVEESSTTSDKGSALDGDGDGIAGGDFDFWFRTTSSYGAASPSPRTLVVDKAYTGVTTAGTLAQPFKKISDAVSIARSGDIIRLAGVEAAKSNPTSVRAYEIGSNSFGPLADGDKLEVPKEVTLMIDAGAIIKMGNSRILVGSDGVIDRSGAAIQVLGTPTLPVYFTSHTDQSIGIDTNPLTTVPKPGDWGGIEIRNDADRSQGRFEWEREGIFLNTISNAEMTYGGGLVGVGAQAKVTSPIELAEARPLILGNFITLSVDSAISADPNSFEETLFTEPRYQNAGRFVPDYRRVGPAIYNNRVVNNTINGLFVRVETFPGQPLKTLTTHARMDDTEITIVFGENFLIAGTPGGPLHETVGPNTTLMIVSPTAPTPGSAGFPAAAALDYLVTYVDRFGQESLPSVSTPVSVPANQSVRLSNIPAATGDYVSRKIYRRTNGTGDYQLVALLNRDDTQFVDNDNDISGAIQTLGLSELNRARQDASLVIDPGTVAKLFGTRLEVGIGATLIAEGTETKPIIFTSRWDDRYGAGGTFDTNNDQASTAGAPGHWSGILARHMSEVSIDYARITFGGGESRVPGGFASFSAIELHQSTARIANSLIESNASGRTNTGGTNRDARGNNDASAIFVLASQPVILNNIIRDNSAAGTAAISVDLSSLSAKPVRDFGRSTGFNDRETTLGLGNLGPLVFNNRLSNNQINGMRVRGGTLTSESVWDDTDIVHVLQSEVIVPDFHTFGGLRLVSKADSSLVVKADNNAGITAAGRPLDIKDRIGGTVQILGSPGFPVVITSLIDDDIGAGFDSQGGSLRDTNNDGGATDPDTNPPNNFRWRSVRFTPFSNDRNVDMTYEKESDRIASSGDNDLPAVAQDIGKLAGNLKLGDENLRLGVTLTGSIASPTDLDVYRFSGVAGSTVWMEIDQSAGSLDSMLELIDANGQIMAWSDDSFTESIDAKSGTGRRGDLGNPAYPTTIRAYPMDQIATGITNELEPAANVDFQGTNPKDPGMRVILPGVAGTTNVYYVRVRSSNKIPGVVTDPYSTVGGVSVGAYKLHLRLQEKQEIAGSTIRFADLRYATTGIEIYGNPMHSPLVGEFAELSTDTSSEASSALNLGNVMVNERAGVSVAGTLATASDIDWFNFEVGRDLDSIQRLPSTTGNPGLRVDAHSSLIFDLDYADGLGRANTQLWIFRRDPQSGQLTLVLTGDDSNIQDDQPAILKGTDQEDLTRGSIGKRDAYIGPIELPPGLYTVAITNKSVSAVALQQYTVENLDGIVPARGIRLEPLDSIRRIAEDRFDRPPSSPDPLSDLSTNLAPVQVAFGERVNSTAVPNAGNVGLPNAVPFNLSDVALFASTGRNIRFLNALTGAQEATWSTDGATAVDFGPNTNPLNDLAVAPNGQGVGFQTANPVLTDANAGTFVGIDIGNGAPATVGSGINTFISQIVQPVANPPTFETIQVPNVGGNVGVGMIFDGLTFSSLFGGDNNPTFWGVARRGSQAPFSQPLLDGNNNTVGLLGPGITKNILYRLNSLNDGNVGQARNPAGQSRTGSQQGLGAGTSIVETGYFVQTAGTSFGGVVSGFTPAVGTVTGLANLFGTPTRFHAVTDRGELMGITIGNESAAQVYSDSYTIIRDPETGAAVAFSSLTAGPRNLEGGRYANLLFGIGSNGRIYAFNDTGVLQPIFPRGASFIQAPAGVTGIDFSALDVNLWHATPEDANTAGHGRLTNVSNSRPDGNGTRSLKFGFSNPLSNPASDRQIGNWTGIYNVPNFLDNLSFPGGAMGAIESDLIDLRNYSADDQPMLYFNYLLNSEGTNSALGDNADMLDSLRVYGVGEDGVSVLLATNNSARTPGSYDGSTPLTDEFDVTRPGPFGPIPVNNNQDAFGRSYLTQELFDRGEWRQARVSLAPLAGKRDVKLRFEFATGGDFRAGDSTRGGQELIAVAGDRLADRQTFQLTAAASGNLPALTQTFEFDMGLVLNVPSGRSLKIGDELRILTETFTFTAAAGPNQIPFAPTDRPEAVATSIRDVLTAAGYTVLVNPSAPNMLNITQRAGVRLPDAVTTNDYVITGADDAGIIVGEPGVSPGNIAVNVTIAMSAVDVRNAIRTSLALAFNDPSTPGNAANLAVYPVRGHAIVLHRISIDNRGPLQATLTRVGDQFGPRDGNASPNLFRASAKARNNTNALVRLDDFIIGFAERGEMVLGATGFNGTQFLDTFEYETIGGPNGTPTPQIETGTYQLEIRTAPDYGKTEGTRLALETVPFVGDKGRTYDTNARMVKAIALDTTGLSSKIGDGYHFKVSNGVNEVTFEFNIFTSTTGNDPAYRPIIPGRVRIALSPNATDGAIARAVRNAINDDAVRALLGLTAQIEGDMFGTTSFVNDTLGNRIQINGDVASDLFGSSSFNILDPNGNPILLPNPGGPPSPLAFTTIKYGQDTQWGEDLGDGNIIREQGQMIISGTTVLNSLQYGINLLPVPDRDLSDLFINMDPIPNPRRPLIDPKPISEESIQRPYPGSVRNMITLNNSRLASGPVLVNNILAKNALGGIRVGGDQIPGAPDAPVTVARIVNNTFYGNDTVGTQTGIVVEPNTSPTILSNIFANFRTAIDVANDPALTPRIVIGANLYKGNTSNVVPGNLNLSQSFPIFLDDPQYVQPQPLFSEPTRNQFYLREFSLAIDSSLASLEDRNLLDQVRTAVGLPTSPIIAPEFDAYGLLRSDDPTMSTPSGQGSNVFADRGALDRVDLNGPQAILQRPLDNDSAQNDRDGGVTYLRLNAGNYDYFEILIDERQGTGPDADTITKDNIILTENGRMLSPDSEYVFGYSYNSRTIRLTPLAGFWRQDSVYEITLINKETYRLIAPSNSVGRTDGQLLLSFQVGDDPLDTKVLELDSGYTLTVPAAGVSDGQFFTYRSASGQTTTFEFNRSGDPFKQLTSQIIPFDGTDTRDTLAAKIAAALGPFVRQDGWPVQAIGNGRVAVGGNPGDILDVTDSTLIVEGSPGASSPNGIPVRFLPIASFDAAAMAHQMVRALNQVDPEVKAYTLANGLVFVEGITPTSAAAYTPTPLLLPPIKDLAGNLLQANRANSLTQFTILMPEVAVDYGDAIERSGTGSNSGTLQADNGVRHAIYPDDVPRLVLGALVDGDADGVPSIAADADDFDSSLDLGTLSPFVSVDSEGPARLITSAVSASTFGKTLTITDAAGNVATYQYVNLANPLTNPSFIPVDLEGLSSAVQVAGALKTAVLNSILAGRITGIHAEATGNVVSLGGSRNHLFDLSGAGTEIKRDLAGTLGLTVTSVAGLAVGDRLFITDGYGNRVGFQVINSAAPTVVDTNNYAVAVNLSTATPADLASALATAITLSISDTRLRLPEVSANGEKLVIQGDDEDGFAYDKWFNKDSLPTPITLTASASGLVDAWIDWNQDNDFEDADERILTRAPVLLGLNTFYVTTPATAAVGFTTARFRLSTTGDLFTYGLGIGGEVEDHLVEVLAGSPPSGTGDQYTIAEDNVLIVSAPGVLSNDTDPDVPSELRVNDNDRRTAGVQPVREPTYGYLTLQADGSFVYTPKQDFFGTDTFIYDVTDGRMTGNQSVTVTITVTPVNDAPVVVDDRVTINEDTETTWDGSEFTGNDRVQPDRPTGTDGDLFDTNEFGQILTVVDVELVTPRGLGESLSVVNNRITYRPPTDYNSRIDGPVLVRLLIEDSGIAGGDENPKNPGEDDVPPTQIWSTLTINIDDVNDRPQFNISNPELTPLEDASVTLANFLTDIAPSPSTALDELGPTLADPTLVRQEVRFIVQALDPTRFTLTGQPEISPDGTLTYTLNTDINRSNPEPVSGPILVSVIAEDNGDAPGSRPGRPDLNQSLPQTFTIRPVEVNDPPEFTITNPIFSILEDLENSPLAGYLTNIFAGPSTARDERGEMPGVPGQTVSFVVDALDPTRFAVQPQISPDGTLTYDLNPDVNFLNSGNIVVRVYAVDNGFATGDRPGIQDVNRSTDQFFTILVTDVNDAPQFNIPNPIISINEDLEVSPLAGFLTNIQAGPNTAIDERGLVPGVLGQAVSFEVEALDPTRFSVQPRIDASGTLFYDLRPDINLLNSEDIVVRVYALDSGFADGDRPGIPDVNRSADQFFTIRAREVNDAPQFFIPNPLIQILEDLENSPVVGFVTNIQAGPDTAIDELGLVPGVPGQTVSFVVQALDPSRFAVQPQISPTGTLTYDLSPDVNRLNSGDIVVRFYALDTGPGAGDRPGIPDVNRSLDRFFTIRVAEINDAPEFTIPNRVVTQFEDNEQFTGITPTIIPGFATGIRPGPSTAVDEVGQLLAFNIISSSNPNLFSVQPSVDPLGNLTFVTAADQNGDSVLVVRLEDNGVSTPLPNDNTSNNVTFTIVIQSVNDAPQFTMPSTISSDEDQVPSPVIPGFARDIRPGPETAFDELRQNLAFEVEALDPSVFAEQPSIAVDGTLSYKTAPDLNSNAGKNTRVRVRLRDDGVSGPPPNTNVSAYQTFTLTIIPINDKPIPGQYSTSTNEDTRVLIQAADVLLGAIPGPPDEIGEPQTVRITNIESTTLLGGTVLPVFSGDQILRFEYVPPLNYVGQDIIRYVITDSGMYKPGPGSSTGTLTINILAVNDPPVFTSGSNVTVEEDSVPYAADWATNIAAGPPSAVDELTGPNAQTVSFEVSTNNDSMFRVLPAISPTGQLTFSLAKDANGQVSVIVTAVDNGPSSPPPNNNRSRPATFTISVSPLNDEPDFNVLQSVTVDEDSGPFSGQVLGDIVPAIGNNASPPTALDESTQSITFTTTNDQPGLFAVQPSINPSGILTFTPASNVSGTAIVRVFATDSGASAPPNVNTSATKAFTITIGSSNDAPFAVDDRYNASETAVLNVPARGVLVNDLDADPNDILSVDSFQSTSDLGAQVSVNPNGSFTYNPTVSQRIRELVDGQTIADRFTYRARDLSGSQSNLATVTVTVSGFNDAPVTVDDSFSVPFNTEKLLNVLANDFDVDTPIDLRSIELGILPVNGVAIPTTDGRIRYTPQPGFRGTDSFTYRVRDSLGKYSGEATVSLRVNNTPVGIPDSFIAKQGVLTTLNVLDNDFDTDGTIVPSTVTIVTPPNNANVTVLADGRIEFTSQFGFVGLSRFRYTVSDNDGSRSEPTDVTVNVVSSLYQNPSNAFDVNADSFVSPIDVLVIINLLNTRGPSLPVDGLPGPPDFVDVNGDNSVDPRDALAVINYINSRGPGGEGEGNLGWTYDIGPRSPSTESTGANLQLSQYASSRSVLANAAQPFAGGLPSSPQLSLADFLASMVEEEDELVDSTLNSSFLENNRRAVDEAFADLFDV